jgi:hypothetical protein
MLRSPIELIDYSDFQRCAFEGRARSDRDWGVDALLSRDRLRPAKHKQLTMPRTRCLKHGYNRAGGRGIPDRRHRSHSPDYRCDADLSTPEISLWLRGAKPDDERASARTGTTAVCRSKKRRSPAASQRRRPAKEEIHAGSQMKSVIPRLPS